jgi:MATE family multidrug resistance protein
MNKKSQLQNLYLGKGGIKEMLIIALPMVATYACDIVMQITDRLYMAQLAPEAMNAVMGGGLAMLMLSFFLSINSSSTSVRDTVLRVYAAYA